MNSVDFVMLDRSSVRWTTEMEIRLIDFYKEHPILWDKKNVEYFDRTRRHAELLKLSNEFGPEVTPDEIKKKFDNIRTIFRREHQKVEELRQSHPDVVDGSTRWKYYYRLLYLREHVPDVRGAARACSGPGWVYGDGGRGGGGGGGAGSGEDNPCRDVADWERDGARYEMDDAAAVRLFDDGSADTPIETDETMGHGVNGDSTVLPEVEPPSSPIISFVDLRTASPNTAAADNSVQCTTNTSWRGGGPSVSRCSTAPGSPPEKKPCLSSSSSTTIPWLPPQLPPPPLQAQARQHECPLHPQSQVSLPLQSPQTSAPHHNQAGAAVFDPHLPPPDHPFYRSQRAAATSATAVTDNDNIVIETDDDCTPFAQFIVSELRSVSRQERDILKYRIHGLILEAKYGNSYE